MKKRKRKILFALISTIFIFVTVVYVAGKYFSEKVIPQGYYIGKIYVGGKTRDEAITAISSVESDELLAKPLALFFDDNKKITRFEFTPSQAGLSVDPARSVDKVIDYFQEFRYFKAVFLRFNKQKNFIFPVMKMEDEKDLKDLLESYISDYVNRQSSEATFRVEKDESKKSEFKVKLVNEQIGRRLIIDETVERFKQALEQGKDQSKLVVHYDYPKLTSSALKEIPHPSVIGTYTTYYGTHDSKNRIHNIYLVSSFIDNKIVMSGEVFSVLRYVGEFTQERGFKEAFVIIKDELVPEYGGGTCQIATTLYNAVQLADLDIVSRSNHGMYFGIYPLGRDAAVYPPYLDLKFRNNTGHPILIQARPFKKGLTFYIIGEPTGKKVSFSDPTVIYKYIDVTTSEAGSGKEIKKRAKALSFKTIVIKSVEKNGKTISTEKIYSFYKLDGDKVKVKKRRDEPR